MELNFLSVADAKAVEDAICAHICERLPDDPPAHDDLIPIILPLLPAGADAAHVLSIILPAMLASGKIETFEDEERGAVYVRGC